MTSDLGKTCSCEKLFAGNKWYFSDKSCHVYGLNSHEWRHFAKLRRFHSNILLLCKNMLACLDSRLRQKH